MGPLKRTLEAGLQIITTALGEADPLAKGAIDAADRLIDAIPEIDEDDVSGAFVIHLQNVNSKLEMAWVPWTNYSTPEGRAGATTLANNDSYFVRALKAQGNLAVQFNFQATRRGQYRVVIVAKEVVDFTDEQLDFLGTTFDQCSQEYLFVNQGTNSYVAINLGQSHIRVNVPSNPFHWYFGGRRL